MQNNYNMQEYNNTPICIGMHIIMSIGTKNYVYVEPTDLGMYKTIGFKKIKSSDSHVTRPGMSHDPAGRDPVLS